MPSRPAIAVRWIIALVEPPMLCVTISAFRNAAAVMISLGRGPFSASVTARAAGRFGASRMRSACIAGIVADNGKHHAERFDRTRHRAGGAHHHARACGRREPLVDRLRFRSADPIGAVVAQNRRQSVHAPSARPDGDRPASARPATRSPARRPMPRPSAARESSCRSRRSARPNPSAARESSPRCPSPSGCAGTCWSDAQTIRESRPSGIPSAGRPRASRRA